MDRSTWDTQTQVNHPDQASIMRVFRAAGFPLSDSGSAPEDNDQGKIVCVASTANQLIHAVIATPSGMVFRFEPDHIDVEFWSFAARNHYMVTGNAEDRREIAQITGVPAEEIKGKVLLRGKSEQPSGMPLDAILHVLGYPEAVAEQMTLF